MTRAEIEQTYAISRRIEAEERCLDNAMLVFTSTQQEIDEQWGLYNGYAAEIARVLRFRHSSGRHMALAKVSPPGLDFSSMKVHGRDGRGRPAGAAACSTPCACLLASSGLYWQINSPDEPETWPACCRGVGADARRPGGQGV